MTNQIPPVQPPVFIHEIRVTWADCDPAKIAYTGRIPLWALDSINAWLEHHLDGDGWFQLNVDRNTGTPFVHMEMDFRGPITPRHRLMCEVRVVRLGTASIEYKVIGRQDGALCFEGSFVSVFVNADKFEPKPAPADIRQIIEPLLQPETQDNAKTGR